MFEDEYRDGKSSRCEYRCRVCDGPVKPVQLVCDECDRRDTKEMERDAELYGSLLLTERPVYKKLTEKDRGKL